MSTATPAAPSLDSAQRAWLKKLGVALDAPLAEPSVKASGTPRTGLEPVHPERKDRPEEPPKPPSVAGKRLLKEPCSGPDVKDLQTLLNKHGASLKADGIFGPNTTKAVKEFQTKNPPLQADGIVGPQTWAALSAAPPQPPQPPDTKPRKAIITVTDQATNDAIKNATVKVGEQAENTGNTGQATLSLPPGKHSFIVTADGYEQASGAFEVTSGEETAHHVELKSDGSATGDLTVSVLDKDTGKPVKNASVQIDDLKPDSTGEQDFHVVVISGLKRGKHTYRVTAKGYDEDRGAVEVTGKSTPPLRVTLTSSPLAVTTIVLDAVTNQPIQDGTVEIDGKSATTDSKGSAVHQLRPGDYRFRVTAKDHQEVSGTLPVTTDETFQNRVFLKPIGAPTKGVDVMMQITDVRGFALLASFSFTPYQRVFETLETNGIAIIDNVPPGRHDYHVTAKGFLAKSGSVTTTGKETSEVKEEVQLEDCVGIILVKDRVTGEPIRGATVEYGKLGKRETDDKGRAEFRRVPPGTHTYHVTAKGYEELRADVELTSEMEFNIPIDVRLRPAQSAGTTTVSLFVKDDVTGRPLSGALVEFPGFPPEETVAKCIVNFLDVPIGIHKYRVTAKGYDEKRGSVTVMGTEESPISVDVGLSPADAPLPPGTETGRLIVKVSRNREPVASELISLFPVDDPSQIRKKRTGPDGLITFTLPIGQYHLVCSVEPKHAEAKVEANKDAKAEFNGEPMLVL